MDDGDDRTINLQDDVSDDETLSLSDFPLDHHHSPAAADSHPRSRRSSSEPPDFFEFLKHNHTINTPHVMCSADDVIVSGKLMPFKGQPPNPTRNQEKTKLPLRSRSDSSATFKGTTPTVKLTRSSRSLDGASSVRGSFGKSEVGLSESKKSPAGTTKPRWYLYMMMFGVAKFPTEMELRDIRTRQLRRTPTTAASVDGQVAGGENFPARHRHRTGSWKLLQALSCKNYASVAVATTSFEGFISNHYSYE